MDFGFPFGFPSTSKKGTEAEKRQIPAMFVRRGSDGAPGVLLLCGALLGAWAPRKERWDLGFGVFVVLEGLVLEGLVLEGLVLEGLVLACVGGFSGFVGEGGVGGFGGGSEEFAGV